MNTRKTALVSLCAAVAALSISATAWSKDVRFVARDFDGKASVWQADSVVLDRTIDGEGELTFVLENPTGTEHAFVMPGVQVITREVVLTPEQSVDVPEPVRMPYVEPLVVTVKPGETKRIRVHTTDLLSARSTGKGFRYFCNIHKDVHQSGELFVM